MKAHKHTRRVHTPTTCQHCGTRIPPLARKHGDPFCSRVCAEATYGTHTRSSPGRMIRGLWPNLGKPKRGGAAK